MVVALGSVAAVQRLTGISPNQVDTQAVEDYLAEADRQIRAAHFNQYMSDLLYANSVLQTGQVNKVYELYFPQKTGSTSKVYVNGALLTATTDYTISSSTLTFTASYPLTARDRIIVYYTPEFFDDYANYLAALKILSSSVVDSSNGIMLQNISHLKDSVTVFQRSIATKPHVARAMDSSSGVFGPW